MRRFCWAFFLLLTVIAGAALLVERCGTRFDYACNRVTKLRDNVLSQYQRPSVHWVDTSKSDSPPAFRTFVVDPENGSDSNDGSDASPWATISKANDARISPGDTLQLKWNGFQRFRPDAKMLLAPRWSGANGKEITIENYSGFSPGLQGSKPRSHDLVTFDRVSYIKLAGDIRIGDTSQYVEAKEGSGSCSYSHFRSLYIRNGAHHLDIDVNEVSGACNYSASVVDETVSMLRIKDTVFRNQGSNDHDRSREDSGDLLRIKGADQVIMEGNTMSLGGHNVLNMQANRGVFRDNHNSNLWRATTSDYPGGRAAEWDSTWSNKGATPPFGPVLVEDNILRGGGASRDNPSNPVVKFSNYRGIFRFNYLFDAPETNPHCINSPIIATDNTVSNQTREMTIAYNTCYEVGIFWYANQSDGPYTGTYDGNWFISNIATGLYSGNDTFLKGLPKIGNESYATVWKGDFIDGNYLSRADGGSVKVKIIDNGPTAKVVNLLSAHETWPENFTSSNTQGVPSFVNPGAGTKSGFALRTGSAGLNTGRPIANTVGAYRGTTVTVDRPQAFYDGWGMGYFGEDTKMDCVKIGSNPIAQIRYDGVDSEAGTITVDSAVSGASGESIYWSQDCKSVADNAGANQTDP